MAHPLTEAHIRAERRLRRTVARLLEEAWRGLPGYDDRDVPKWLRRAVPIVSAGQRQSIAITEAYLARYMGRQPRGVDAEALIESLRGSVAPEDVYRRPFVTLWSALAAGRLFEEASSAALARLTGTAEMDIQLAARATFDAVERGDDGMFGYQRVADGDACEFCQMIDGAYVKSGDAMSLHDRCGCSLEPLTEPHRRAARLPSGVAVHQHGELGAVLGAPGHNFTTEAEALG